MKSQSWPGEQGDPPETTLAYEHLTRVVLRATFFTELHVARHILTAPNNERIRSDSSQLFFRCYFYFASAVFVVQRISVSGAGFGCMIESVTIK